MSQQINLYHPLLRKQKKYFSALTMAQALGLLLAGIVAFYAYLSFQVKATAKHEAELSRLLATRQAALDQLNARIKGRQKSQQLEAEATQLTKQVDARRKVFDMLERGDFGNTQGFSEPLRAFSRQSVPGLWLTGFVISGKADGTQISGRALQADLVPLYINRLKQEPAMQGKSFAVLEISQPSDAADVKDQAKQAAPANFLEFSLYSAEQDKAADKGAKAK